MNTVVASSAGRTQEADRVVVGEDGEPGQQGRTDDWLNKQVCKDTRRR